MPLLSGQVFLIDGQKDGLTALHVACVGGNKEVVEALLSAGASVEASAVCYCLLWLLFSLLPLWEIMKGL